MRDGAKLFTAIYLPKDRTRTYPIMLTRTPYSVAPYGVDQYRNSLGLSELFQRSGYIFAYQDVRGRYMSEGTFQEMRPHKQVKAGPNDTDESTDTWDTIDWLVKNIPGNSGKVGLWGISYPGFFVTAGMIDAHPAFVAASPQGAVTDLYLGDDAYHNGAFMLAANFGFYTSFVERKGGPAPPEPTLPFNYGTPDGYEFYLHIGPLIRAGGKYFKNPNRYWKARGIWKYIKDIKPSVLLVGGWFDAEDCQGPLRINASLAKNSPATRTVLVEGPWTHGGWARTDGDRVGNVTFGSKTSVYYRERIEFPFFEYYLKGKGEGRFPRAWVFETGRNQWREYGSWPPAGARAQSLWLQSDGRLAWEAEAKEGYDEYISDPQKPVPYVSYITMGMQADYMTEDQRFAAQRPDVLVYETDPLRTDITAAGPVDVSLMVSTSGTDSDFVVKLIDVYPGDYPEYRPRVPQSSVPPSPQVANDVKMGGYQQLVRGEPFRGKFRKDFEKPVPFEPGRPDRIEFSMPDICHTFRKGHRIMVQIQSSWFPLTDRNPQKFLDIPAAGSSDFQKATQRVFHGGSGGSRVTLWLMPGSF
jgi:hypothetical protein